jgi:hypothetical protein
LLGHDVLRTSLILAPKVGSRRLPPEQPPSDGNRQQRHDKIQSERGAEDKQAGQSPFRVDSSFPMLKSAAMKQLLIVEIASDFVKSEP